jgi:membrane-associated phospholipid phosphatase
MPNSWNMKHQTRIVAPLFMTFLLFFTAGVSARASDVVQITGDVLTYVLPATAAGMTLGFKDGKGALQFGESAAFTLIATYGLKYAIDEERPNGGNHSFPSTHASISFCSAEFVRKRYGWGYGIPAYLAASFVAYSRVEAKEHHPQDVIAGAAIGIISSYIFTRPYKGWQARMDADGKYFGIRLIRIW